MAIGRQLFLFGKRLEDKVKESKRLIHRVIRERENVGLAFSGGKDSTTLLLLTLEVLEETEGQVHVIHTDTMVENPQVRQHADRFLEELRAYVETKGLDVHIHIARPPETKTYWVSLIGKGYPPPNFAFRWCQKNLKIEPANRLMKELDIDTVLVGLRRGESVARKNSIKKNYRGHTATKEKRNMVAPLLDWDADDIWEFLTSYECEWTDLMRVYELYREASGECPVFAQGDAKACGARFGCWVCTLASDLPELKNAGMWDKRLLMLLDFRNWLKEYGNRKENRTGRRRSGKELGEGKGQLTLKARQEILRGLFLLQERTGMELIRDWEIELIKKEWEKEC